MVGVEASEGGWVVVVVILNMDGDRKVFGSSDVLGLYHTGNSVQLNRTGKVPY